jgi:hypothetical protein
VRVEDPRISVVPWLGASLDAAFKRFVTSWPEAQFAQTVIFAPMSQPATCPAHLRWVQVASDELAGDQACLCCSLKSELAQQLSQLFFAVLGRKVPMVSAVVVLSGALDATALEATLRHAPFISQRYRLVTPDQFASDSWIKG